jgi:hypothetical protein
MKKNLRQTILISVLFLRATNLFAGITWIYATDSYANNSVLQLDKTNPQARARLKLP